MPKRRCQDMQQRIADMWSQPSAFGEEDEPASVYLSIIANRYALVKGAQLIRDELLLAFNKPGYHNKNKSSHSPHLAQCAANLSLPSVLTTCGYTMCGDRICQSRALSQYKSMIAGRFGSMTEGGENKPEFFFATGGGTDSGPTLAHVTVGHALDSAIKKKMYTKNAESCFLCNIDVCTHCGHLEVGPGHSHSFLGNTYDGVGAVYGLAQESVFRDPRPTCGAIVGMISNFNMQNPVHVRLRNDLGEANFNYLKNNDVQADDGSSVRFLIAAAIIAIQGMRNTLDALGPGGELDERGVGHMTAQVQVNNREGFETILYCARATVFNGVITEQGLGTDASKFTAEMVTNKDGVQQVKLIYDGVQDSEALPIVVRTYDMKSESEHADMDTEEGIDVHMRPLSRSASWADMQRAAEEMMADEALDSDSDMSMASSHSVRKRSLQNKLGSRPRSKRGSLAKDQEPMEKSTELVVKTADKEGGIGFYWACVLVSAFYIALLSITIVFFSQGSVAGIQLPFFQTQSMPLRN
eukprot:CAMPEP_0196720306 /NCGR_PEP_ID=MMETSP1091-20130531/3108_1 /TAXON_ID=302021 /ORGANISM="Rhodomonas sp., Strain CCMP768" /LENGTH=524 /DNA_ID=CAMNT_0042061489 /DNA_START=119 /DNA_END=1693 /DNA_ORIENTATION=+